MYPPQRLFCLLWLLQQEGNLCAQHCLNALLQGPYFTAIDLAELARQLDDQEQDALGNLGVGSQPVKSQNMDDSGFFSVQVLSHALSIWGVQIIPWGAKEVSDAKMQPERETAFICNLDLHWYTLRRFGPSTQRWYDLNSMHPRPQPMSAIYLGMTLSQLEQEGYSIFVVRPLNNAEESTTTEVQESNKSETQNTSLSSSTSTPVAEKQLETTPAAAGQSTFLTERQEMERIRRQRLEEREKGSQQQTEEALSSSSSSSAPDLSYATESTSRGDVSAQKRTRVDHLGDEVEPEGRESSLSDILVTTKPFLPRCEVDDMVARMPAEDKRQKLSSASQEQMFGGAGYRLGGSPPLSSSQEAAFGSQFYEDAPLPAEFMVTDQDGFVDENDEDIERIMMEQAIAMSLLPDQK
ncbi:Ataxin-3 [Gryganskiella cystojenkinii]|nr:Ataxin-3 [Gryganskiella cystojenkinii]